jgi:3-hydroxymyristoyl/3-hydroxydecanoyl-(acyl carrier protein) dehydratase
MTGVVEIVVPADHPALPGHFAGRPIVPAAWILTLVDAACRDALRTTGARGVVHARFRAPLLPGMPLAIAFERADGDRVAFRCTSGGTRIADGVLDA